MPFELPQVAGRRINCSLDEMERRALVCLMSEGEKVDADNALVALLCDTVRLCREHGDLMNDSPAAYGFPGVSHAARQSCCLRSEMEKPIYTPDEIARLEKVSISAWWPVGWIIFLGFVLWALLCGGFAEGFVREMTFFLPIPAVHEPGGPLASLDKFLAFVLPVYFIRIAGSLLCAVYMLRALVALVNPRLRWLCCPKCSLVGFLMQSGKGAARNLR